MIRNYRTRVSAVVALCWVGCTVSTTTMAQATLPVRNVGDFAPPGDPNRSAVYAAALFANGLLVFAEHVSGRVFVADSRGGVRCEVKQRAWAQRFSSASSIRTTGSLAALLDQPDTRIPTARLSVFDAACRMRTTILVPMSSGQTAEILGVTGADWIVQRVTKAHDDGGSPHADSIHKYELLRVSVSSQRVSVLSEWRDDTPRQTIRIGLHERVIEPLFAQPVLFGVAHDEIVELSSTVPWMRFRALDGTEQRRLRVGFDTIRVTAGDREAALNAKYPESDGPAGTSITARAVASRLPGPVFKPVARWMRVGTDGTIAIVRSSQRIVTSAGEMPDSVRIDLVDASTGHSTKHYTLPPDVEILDISASRILAKRNTRSATRYDSVHYRFGVRLLTFEKSR